MGKQVMKKIESIINLSEDKSNIERFKYDYQLPLAKKYWDKIAHTYTKNVKYSQGIVNVWTNLIKWSFGDTESLYDVNKSIYLMGRTGSGKTLTSKILSDFISVDNIKFKREGKIVPLNYKTYSAREIAANYEKDGFDGINKYLYYSNICIDDLGTEPKEVLHFGTRLDVLTEIIERRYEIGRTTHFTSNLDEEDLIERYNDRIYSRIKHSCNMIILNDKDFRL